MKKCRVTKLTKFVILYISLCIVKLFWAPLFNISKTLAGYTLQSHLHRPTEDEITIKSSKHKVLSQRTGSNIIHATLFQ